ncbi:MAG: precorrin-3B C(17)-methyltransferase [Cyanobacteria bacterium P01_A01_bin.123]
MANSQIPALVALATTPQGASCLVPICQAMAGVLWIPNRIQTSLDPRLLACEHTFYEGSLRDVLTQFWPQSQLVFALATGAVVRLIAPLLRDKATDPAVVVVDETGQFVISLCGGHQGGADRLTHQIAQVLTAQPIVTGAAHHLGFPGIDVVGEPFGWQRGSGDWTRVSAAIARNAPIQVIQDCGSSLWRTALPAQHSFQWGWPPAPAETGQPGQASNPEPPQGRVWISPIQRRFAPDAALPKVQWHPRVLWVGLGCERGTSAALMDWAIQQVFQTHHLAPAAIAGIASLTLKADESGLLALCETHRWPLRCFPPEALKPIPVPQPSTVVEKAVGTPSVAEAAALLAAYQPIVPIDAPDLALTPEALTPEQLEQLAHNIELRVSKQVFRQPGEPGAVTLAVAQADQEYIGRSGQLFLVGTGPGNLDQMTPAAKGAIAQVDVIIGYSLYLDLIQPLLRPGQIVEAFPITQEQQRAERAIELAAWGLKVAVVSSGDAGIYGMAGLVLESLHKLNWDGKTPDVQVFPGITALQAAAARVGTPLMHDFCAISLSDLLTPWAVIEKRLVAAAQADFVIALYNPKSKTRTRPLAIAHQILCQHRPATTPVAIVRSAYRPDETITLTTLAELLTQPIDMVTTLLIGNNSSLKHHHWMITPRGYLGFGK